MDRIDDNRKTEEQISREFDAIHPRLFGALLDVVSACVRTYRSIVLETPPRLADYAIWAEAAMRHLGHEPLEFMAVYERMRQGLFDDVATGDVVVRAILDWRGRQSGQVPDCFEFSPDEFLKELRQVVYHTHPDGSRAVIKDWPKNGPALARRIKRNLTSLRQRGLEVELCRDTSNRSRIRIHNATRVLPSEGFAVTPSLDDDELPF